MSSLPVDGTVLGRKLSNKYNIVALCNDEEILDRNLLASDFVRSEQIELQVLRGASSAAAAYNRAFNQSDAEYVIFAHQDVYFPPGWLGQLDRAIVAVEKTDPDWAVIAPIGMSPEANHVGQVWSTGVGALIGRELQAPKLVQSVDELVIVLRRASGVRFDDAFPDFHMFGTDIVQTALAAGKGSYACQLPLVHNDKFHDHLGSDFKRAYQFMRRKWRAVLPLRTTVLWISATGLDLTYFRAMARRSLKKRQAKALDDKTDPRVFSRKCGWENL